MADGNVKDLPASLKTAEPEHGGVHRAILESMDQGYCTIEVAFDEHGKPVDYCFLEVSRSFERLTGIENGAGRWMREINAEQDQFWFDVYGRVAHTGEPERFENFSTPLDRWFSVYAFKIEGPARVAVLFDDISDRKRDEAALQTSQQQFELLLNQAPLGVYLVDSDFVIRQVNPVALPVFGDIPGGAVGRDFDEVMHILWDKDYADEVVSIFRHTLDTGEPYVTPERAEYRVDRDTTEYYEWRLDRLSLAEGQHGVVCYFRDISPQVNARKEIEEGRQLAHENEERYRTLFEAIDSGFCIIDMIFGEDGRATDYRFVETNPAFELQSGLVDAVGRRIREYAPDLEEHWFERYGRVALTGESMRIEGEVAPLGRWFDINAFRVGASEQRRVAVLFNDITSRRNAEIAVHESEERQAFLLKLSDALRAESSAEAVANQALRMLTEQMGLSRCYVGIYHLEEDRAEFLHQLHDDSLPPLPAEVRLSDFPKGLELVSQRTLVIDNVTGTEGLSDLDRASIEALGVRALINATLRKGGNNPLWALVAGSIHPRAWTPGEVSLVEEVAERTWAAVERARAEEARAEQLAAARELQKLSAELIRSDDPGALHGTLVSVMKAIMYSDAASMQSFDPETNTLRLICSTGFHLDSVKAWASVSLSSGTACGAALMSGTRSIIPDVERSEHMKGTTALDEFRRSGLSAVQSTPLIARDGRMLGMISTHWKLPHQPSEDRLRVFDVLARQAADLVERAQAEEVLRDGERRQSLLLAELQHRVRNILTMVRSVARRTADNCEDVDDYVRHLDGRLAALARMQTILTRDTKRGVDLHNMVLDELQSQSASPAAYRIEGPDIALAPKAAEVLSLAVHELATNSTKYGVLARASGMIRIGWTVDDRDGQAWLRWTWQEPVGLTIARPARTGFGTDLIENRVPYELGGTGEFGIDGGEVVARIDFPLAEGQSKLQGNAADRDIGQ